MKKAFLFEQNLGETVALLKKFLRAHLKNPLIAYSTVAVIRTLLLLGLKTKLGSYFLQKFTWFHSFKLWSHLALWKFKCWLKFLLRSKCMASFWYCSSFSSGLNFYSQKSLTKNSYYCFHCLHSSRVDQIVWHFARKVAGPD